MSKLRLIHCGVGGFGYSWLMDITSQSPDFDVAAIVDISRENLDKAGADAGIPANRRFTDLETAMSPRSRRMRCSASPLLRSTFSMRGWRLRAASTC